MDSYVDVSEMEMDLLRSTRDETPFDYPSPSASSDADLLNQDNDNDTDNGRLKKKRKAWGQPVPEIVPILPPRKRAKTAEEKEQRKNERILRNRRAADKSRQRQKAAQAELEQQNKDLVAENAQLKALLSQHGLLSGFKFMTPPPSVDLSVTSPMEQQHDDTPTFSADTPAPSIKYQESPTLAPTLDLNKVTNSSTSIQQTGMTQYPAVVLCDLQCQPVLDTKLRFLQPSSMVNTVLTLIHYLTIAKNSLTSTLSPMSRVYQILERALAPTSTQLESIVLNNFELIHILISMPSTSTQPAVFRLKLLSRLLACNPSLAPLLKTAADRALQQRLSEDNWTADPDHRWAVASLMTIKWSIEWLSKEHSNMRMQFRYGRIDRDSLFGQEQKGVDCMAVEKHYRLFDEIDPKPCLVVSPTLATLIPSIEAH